MIGLISFHCQYNYGSALQAWAMQTTLEHLGYECIILNFYYKKDMKTYGIRWYSKRLSVIAFDLLTAPAMWKRKQAFHAFQDTFFCQTERTRDWKKLAHLGYDCEVLICGSDQIWNYSITEGLHPAYFLDFARSDQQKIAYAPSINQTPIATQMKTQLIEKLESFSAISVREQDAAQQLSLWMKRPITAVLDPTLLLQASDYDLILEKCSVVFPEHYIFIYCLHLNHLPFLRQYAEAYAASHNVKIVYCNKFDLNASPYAMNIFRYGPETFVSAIKKADYVIADSFHAAAFSIIFQKDFATYSPDSCPSRMNTLFSSLGIGNRFITDIHQALPEIPYDIVCENLRCLQESSLDYLKNALE